MVDTTNGNLPSWPGAATVYSRMYKLLAHMARNGHGAGFWDGDWREPEASQLDTAARAFRSVDLYIGDDGRIYGS